jgi:hypothetical protein
MAMLRASLIVTSTEAKRRAAVPGRARSAVVRAARSRVAAMVYSFFVVFAEVYRFCGALLWMAASLLLHVISITACFL